MIVTITTNSAFDKSSMVKLYEWIYEYSKEESSIVENCLK